MRKTIAQSSNSTPALPAILRPGPLGQQLRRHHRDPCPTDHHRDSEGQNDESHDGPDTIGPNSDSYKGGEEEHAGCHRVYRPSPKSLGGKAASKHETRRDQPEEADPTTDEVQETVPTDSMGVRWRSGWEAQGRIGDEEASANQTQPVNANEYWSQVPPRLPARTRRIPTAPAIVSRPVSTSRLI